MRENLQGTPLGILQWDVKGNLESIDACCSYRLTDI